MVVTLVSLLFISVVFSLWPTLMAPIAADDRYWAIEIPARFGNSPLEAVRGTWEDIPDFMQSGRLAPLAYLARRLLGMAIFQLSVVMTSPLILLHGFTKVLLLVLGVTSCVVLVKVLRWRRPDGQLAQASTGTSWIVSLALISLLAVGVTSHQQFRNGWTAYPLLTYGAVIAVFGSAALAVFLARRISQSGRLAIPIGIGGALSLAVLLNWTYELYYVGLPLALFVLWVFPLTHAGGANDRRGKLMVGGSLTLAFLAVFVGTRLLLADICHGDSCYQGTVISLGPNLLRTAWFNLASSIPGFSATELTQDLATLGASTDGSYVGELWLVGLVIGLCLYLLWRWASSRWSVSEVDARAESQLLMILAIASLMVGLGGALIMSVSAQSQEVINRVGIPYRHTVLTWMAIALSVVLIVRSIELRQSTSIRFVLVASLCGLITVASIHSLPRNLAANGVYTTTPGNRAITDLHWEVIAGDLSDVGNERRCQTFERVEASVRNAWVVTRLEPAADQVFRDLYGISFCEGRLP